VTLADGKSNPREQALGPWLRPQHGALPVVPDPGRLNPCAMAKMPKLSSLLVRCRTRCEVCRIVARRCAVLFGRVYGGPGRRVEDVAVADDGGGPALVLELELADFVAGLEGGRF
jgi:hypothetical protein